MLRFLQHLKWHKPVRYASTPVISTRNIKPLKVTTMQSMHLPPIFYIHPLLISHHAVSGKSGINSYPPSDGSTNAATDMHTAQIIIKLQLVVHNIHDVSSWKPGKNRWSLSKRYACIDISKHTDSPPKEDSTRTTSDILAHWTTAARTIKKLNIDHPCSRFCFPPASITI